ncbi:MAG: hypothetical protein KJP07_16525, partial [Desulfatitalea sp.]|nr:hypothetical protein [Desulfatitalea sp.]
MQETITPKRTSTFEIEDDVTSFIQKLREYAIRGLYRMFMDKDDRFIFSMRQTPRGVRKVGVSSRYTAISLIGLATLENETAMAILSGRENKALCRSLA